MYKVWQRTIVNEAGDTLPSAQIDVYLEDGVTRATLYDDADGVTPLTNPFNADAEGFAQFYTSDGVYKITANLGGSSATWDNVFIGWLNRGDITTLTTPVVDIDTQTAVNAKALKGGFTFERTQADPQSTSATNRYGNIEYYDNDQERFGEHGLLVEPQATNLLTYSQNLSDSSWSDIFNVWTAFSHTSPAPDGSNTATTVDFTGSAVPSIRKAVTLTQGETYTFSFWCKAEIGSIGSVIGGSTIDLGDGTAVAFDKALNNQWQRITATAVAGAGNHIDINFDSTNGDRIVVWGFQFELGSIATSYIPTTTTAITRNRDTIDLDPTNFPTITSGVTIHQKWWFDDITSYNYNGNIRHLFSIGTGSNNRIGAYILDGNLRAYTDIGTDRLTEGALNLGEVDMKFVMDEVDNILYINGIEVSRASRGGDNIINSIVQLFIGRYLATGDEANAQHIFTKIYPKALTASECRL